jgi:CRISPR-associated protein (TIGR02584 family)
VADPAFSKVARSRNLRNRPDPARAAVPALPTVLLSVAGLTPQVVTETLYCLVKMTDPSVAIRQVRIITTRAGEERIRETLLHPRDGWFHRFRREFGIPPGTIHFDSSCILVPKGPGDRPLDDVRTPAENALIGDCILSLVRDLTRDPGTSLHCSVAGGRKTMGLFLGIAFQLFARPQDRLSHVLVSPAELEGCTDFFYPPIAATTYQAGDKRIRSRDARVELAEIPVLLLRDKLRVVNVEQSSYTALIEEAQIELDRQTAPPALVLDARSRSVRVAEQTISLTALEFAVYRLFAAARARCGKPGCPGCDACAFRTRDFQAGTMLDALREAVADLGVRDERTRRLAGWDRDGDERFLQVRSRIERKLRSVAGPGRWAAGYIISARGRRGETIYTLPLQPDLIRLA